MNERIATRALFGADRALVGMVHLPALPGAPGWGGSMQAVLDAACGDAQALQHAGFHGILIENFGDAPFAGAAVGPVTVAALTAAVAAVLREVTVPVGINVLRNDAAAALAIAVATGARFMRVNVHTGALLTDQGWLTGQAHDTLRERARLGANVAILADVLVKHAVIPPGLDAGAAARDTWHRGHADALVVSGGATGEATPGSRLDAVRAAVPDAPLWIGSGLAPANAAALLARADGAIVGSAVQRDGRAGNRVDAARARALIDAARRD
jgi:uncharacterized protein